MPFCNRAEGRLYYELENSRGLPVLVLSNSLGTTCGMWQPQMRALSEHFSVLRYDARGQGQSSVPAGPYTMDQLGSDVQSLLDHLKLPRVHFCGLSMGGMVGQWLAIHAPDRIDKLVLCNTAAQIGTVDLWNQRMETVGVEGMSSIVPTVRDRWFTADFCASHPSEVAAAGSMLQASDPAGYAACCAAIRDMDFRKNVESIKAPTLIVFGRQDRVTTSEDAHFLAQHIAGAKTLVLEAAHLSNIEAAESFNQGILQFLKQGASS